MKPEETSYWHHNKDSISREITADALLQNKNHMNMNMVPGKRVPES